MDTRPILFERQKLFSFIMFWEFSGIPMAQAEILVVQRHMESEALYSLNETLINTPKIDLLIAV
jgi:hypothetical protein